MEDKDAWMTDAKDDLHEAAGLVGKVVANVAKQALVDEEARNTVKQIVKARTG